MIMILGKAIRLPLGWLLFSPFIIISISHLISPVVSGTEVDYIYDLGAERLLTGEQDLFDLENDGLSGPLAGDNLGRVIPSAVVAFDIGASRDEKSHHYLEESADKLKFNNSGDGDMGNDSFKSKLSRTGDYVFGTLLVIFGIISLLGNGCILLTFCARHRRLSPAEVFLVNLAIVDILLAVASYPMAMISSFRHRWDFGELGCTVYAFICYFLGVASIFSVTTIALVRYLKTCSPVMGNRINCLTSCKMIGWGYLIALIWAGLPLLGFGNYEREPFGLSCTLDWIAKDQASRLYLILVTIFCVILPLIIILFSYFRIMMLVKQSDNLVRSSGVMKRNMKGDAQLTWITIGVSLGFIIGWGPYTIVSLWSTFQGELFLPMWLLPVPVLMAKSSICFNPIIYFFFTARYRDDFTDFFHALRGGKRHPNNKNQQGSPSKMSCTNKIVTRDSQDSPENLSLTGRHLTTSSQLTPMPLQYPMERNTPFPATFGAPKTNNNYNSNVDDNDNHQVENETGIEEDCHQPHPLPSHHLIAKVNLKRNSSGSTTSMIMSTSSSSSNRKLLGVSPSFLSICSGSSGEMEEQV